MVNTYQIPFGKGNLAFDTPTIWDDTWVDIAIPTTHTPLSLEKIAETIQHLAQHILQLHNPLKPIVIVFTDATRACPDQQLVEPLVKYLQSNAYTPLDIQFLCATGMHRPSTHDEKIEKLGEWIIQNFTVIDHDPRIAIPITTIDTIPIEVNPLLQNATVIMIGVVEPHQYAGYSGGYKTGVIGCGGETIIARTHSPEYLDKAGVRLGEVANNPFQQLIRKAGQALELDYAINVIIDEHSNILEIAAGSPDYVHDTLIKKAKTYFEVEVPRSPYDIVIAGLGAPKDANLYQATRAATYIGLSAKPIIRDYGVIIVPAPLPEGGGQGVGEQNFLKALHDFGPTLNLMENLREYGCKPGEQRAYMVAQLLEKYHMIIVGAHNPQIVMDAWLHEAPTMEAAAIRAAKLTDEVAPRILIVPHAIQTMPIASVK